MSNRGIIGGSIIFHGFRYANKKEAKIKGVPFGWRWSPHFHVLGFVVAKGMVNAENAKAVTVMLAKALKVRQDAKKKDGWLVKVLDKRKTVGGTCWYQLNHCSIQRGSKKSHATTWFGACSYRKLEIINGEKDVGIQHKCPICDSELVHVRYLGQEKLLLTRRGEIQCMFAKDGTPLWEIAHEGECHGGCG